MIHSRPSATPCAPNPRHTPALRDRRVLITGAARGIGEGLAKQLPIIGGQPGVMEAHLAVNTVGVFYTLRAAGPHISHPRGDALATASLAEAGTWLTGGGTVSGVAPMSAALKALERGIARRSRRTTAPFWVLPVVPARALAQRVIELKPLPHLVESLEIARREVVDYTTPQPNDGARHLEQP